MTPSQNAFAYPAYRFLWTARLLFTFAAQIIVVAVGWAVYDAAHDPQALGFIGLAQFVPALALVAFTGAAADRFNRRAIISLCVAAELAAALVLIALFWNGLKSATPVYAVLVALGVARAFLGPAQQALLPNAVPKEALASAISWSSSSWQIAAIGGPVAGGLLYGIDHFLALGIAAGLLLGALVLFLLMPALPRVARQSEPAAAALSAGFRYVFSNRIVLGAISLDLFAVLLGGAVALMPAYASDILALGPTGLGLMRAAPGVGAIAVAAVLALKPIRSAAGLKMFAGVALFGAATVIFGLSATPWLSIAMLVLMGASDMVSVYVRETLIQLATPDELRGRVNAVNQVFIGASNELGEFRAGTMAAFIGVVPAVVFGGAGTLVVAAVWAAAFRELRQAERLDGR